MAGCPKGKITYKTEKLAWMSARNSENTNPYNRRRKVKNVYYCTPCCGWHTSSKTKEEWVATKAKHENELEEILRKAAEQ